MSAILNYCAESTTMQGTNIQAGGVFLLYRATCVVDFFFHLFWQVEGMSAQIHIG